MTGPKLIKAVNARFLQQHWALGCLQKAPEWEDSHFFRGFPFSTLQNVTKSESCRRIDQTDRCNCSGVCGDSGHQGQGVQQRVPPPAGLRPHSRHRQARLYLLVSTELVNYMISTVTWHAMPRHIANSCLKNRQDLRNESQ